MLWRSALAAPGQLNMHSWLARRYPDLSPDEQTVVRHLVGTWVEEL
jgi:hypothetical protein